jgi:hypothetical protein
MKGFPLAHCEPVMLVTPLNAVESQTQETTPHLQDVVATARPNLSGEGIQEREELIMKYGDVFMMESDYYRQTDTVYHLINAGDARLIRQIPRRLPIVKQAEMGKMLEDMQ